MIVKGPDHSDRAGSCRGHHAASPARREVEVGDGTLRRPLVPGSGR
jgi:hypothetical protein